MVQRREGRNAPQFAPLVAIAQPGQVRRDRGMDGSGISREAM